MLGFQAKGGVLIDRLAAAGFEAAVEEVAGIKLYTGLRGKYFQLPAAEAVLQHGRFGQGTVFAVEHKIVIIATGYLGDS